MTSLSCSATPLPSLCSRDRSGGDSTVLAVRSVKMFDKRKKVVCCCIAPPPLNLDNGGFSSTKFNIRHGEAVGVIGPSGTGKSMILKIIAGLLAPDKGEVYIRGKKRVGLISDEEISGLRIGLVFQSAALFDSLSVRENVGFLLYERSKMPETQISELVTENLAAVGLKGVENRLPSELSGGMKKRVALARSIIFDTTKEVIEPEVLLYDEPTAGLDPIASTVVEDLIRSVHITGEDAVGKPGNIASYVVVVSVRGKDCLARNDPRVYHINKSNSSTVCIREPQWTNQILRHAHGENVFEKLARFFKFMEEKDWEASSSTRFWN